MTAETQRLETLNKILDGLRDAMKQHVEVRDRLMPIIEATETPEGWLAKSTSSLALNLGSSIAELATLIGAITDVESD